jgi:hypothetical protein
MNMVTPTRVIALIIVIFIGGMAVGRMTADSIPYFPLFALQVFLFAAVLIEVYLDWPRGKRKNDDINPPTPPTTD